MGACSFQGLVSLYGLRAELDLCHQLARRPARRGRGWSRSGCRRLSWTIASISGGGELLFGDFLGSLLEPLVLLEADDDRGRPAIVGEDGRLVAVASAAHQFADMLPGLRDRHLTHARILVQLVQLCQIAPRDHLMPDGHTVEFRFNV